MFFLFMLLVLGTLVFFLVRHGQFGPQTLASSRSPESEAKKSWPSVSPVATSAARSSWSGPAC